MTFQLKGCYIGDPRTQEGGISESGLTIGEEKDGFLPGSDLFRGWDCSSSTFCYIGSLSTP